MTSEDVPYVDWLKHHLKELESIENCFRTMGGEMDSIEGFEKESKCLLNIAHSLDLLGDDIIDMISVLEMDE